MKRLFATAVLAATIAASPAAAVSVVADFSGVGTNINLVTRTNKVLTLDVRARRFSVAPGALTNLTQLTTPGGASVNSLVLTAGGLGISGGGNGGQMDTNSAGTLAAPLREAFLVTGTRSAVQTAFKLQGLKLSAVDADDTLKIFGVNANGSFVDLGYGSTATMAGTIQGGLNGAAIGLANTAANGGTSTFGLANEQKFTRYLITTRIGGDVNFLGTLGQGFALQAVTATVPEPATWGLLLIGFGLVGVAARRRNTAVAA